jgi:S-adenosylmethionine:tRNA ribosyltransferase-isomerase
MSLIDDRLDFTLTADREAKEPAEVRGGGRDAVRLLVSERRSGRVAHHEFGELADVLEPGTLLVVNNSATIPTLIRAGGRTFRFAAERQDKTWLVEIGDATDIDIGSRISLPAGATLTVVARPAEIYWQVSADFPVVDYLLEHGAPFRFSYAAADWPIVTYQTVFSRCPGSTAMPSAGRPFTADLIAKLVASGIAIAPIMLHTSGTSLAGLPVSERFTVPVYTAHLVNATRDSGGQVIAVGTTVVRALESTTDSAGLIHGASGWTEHVVSPATGVRVVDGLITSLHEPRSSHLLLMSAIAAPELLARSYDEAIRGKYLWCEFGDVQLIH